jgi:hypothetical protein
LLAIPDDYEIATTLSQLNISTGDLSQQFVKLHVMSLPDLKFDTGALVSVGALVLRRVGYLSA